MPSISVASVVDAPIQRVFDLARSMKLHTDSMDEFRESVHSATASDLIDRGESVTFRARHFGIWWKLTSRIITFEPPTYFQDSMIDGPFKRFDHDHCFATNGGQTQMTDIFDYELPLGVLGDIVDRLVVSGHMRRLLSRRQHTLKHVAESDEWRKYLPGSE